MRYGRTRKPTDVATILQGTVLNFQVKKKLNSYSCFQYWPEIVGEELAKVAIPEKITRGKILVVRVLDSTWAQELALRKHEILEGFAKLAINGSRTQGSPVFEDVRFVVSGPRNQAERENLKLVVHS